MRRVLFAYFVSVLVGCGGAASEGSFRALVPTGGATCPTTLDDVVGASRATFPGGISRVPIPEGFVRRRGLAMWSHPCGAAIVVSDIDPRLDGPGREEWLRGATDGYRRTALAQGGSPISSGSPGMLAYRMPDGSFSTLTATPAGFAIVRGSLPMAVVAAWVERIDIESGARFDPLRSMGLSLRVPNVLERSPLSSAGYVYFQRAGQGRTGTIEGAEILVQFAPYATADGRLVERSEHEAGQIVGRTFASTWHLETLERPPIVDERLDGGRAIVAFRSQREGRPVVCAAVRVPDELGDVFVLAVIPESESERVAREVLGALRAARVAP